MSLRGLLNQTVTIQQRTASTNAFKGVAKSFATRSGLSNVKAGFKAQKLDENVEFDKTTQRDSYRMYMEYTSASSQVAVTDRVIWGNKTLEVRGEAYNPGGRNVLLHIDCEQIK